MDLKVSNLSKSYDSQKAVDDISFEVKRGEIVGFLGPNGAGKTTTMKMITSYISADKGEVKIGSKIANDENKGMKKYLGYLSENNPLYLDMTVLDYLIFCASLQGLSKHKTKERMQKMIVECGLDKEKHKLISELSKGYRQRVGLAQAMIHNPEILILDEPTTGLDPNQIIEIRKLIKDLGKEKTVILSTHILPEVEAICDRILIINKGKIVANGTAKSLKSKSKAKGLVRVRIEDGKSEDIVKSIQSITSVKEVNAIRDNFYEVISDDINCNRDIFNICVKNKWIITHMNSVEEKLEDIFRDLTT